MNAWAITRVANPGSLSRVAIAAMLTVLLFLLMRYLITPTGGVPQKAEANTAINISRHERDENTQRKQRNKPDRPKQQQTPPPPPMVQQRPRVLANNNALVVEIPDFEGGDNLGELGAPSDRRAIPIVRIPPQYPHRPLTRGIEGWVILEFTITITGTVEEVRIVESEPAGVFDRSASRAIKRWKYQPKLVEGKPVPQMNMRELVTFKIET
jgi:periplasmic protein TonB